MMFRAFQVAAGLCLLLSSPVWAGNPVSHKTEKTLVHPGSEFIFEPGSASFASSHASTVVELKDGRLMAAWFGGTAEGKSDVAIWGAMRTSTGPQGKWSAPRELVREPDVPCWNPVLFYTKDGRLWLYYKFGPNPREWTAGREYSDDDGTTWSPVEHLPAGLIGPVRAKPLVLPDGLIVSGSSVESYHSWAGWIERSEDGGESWRKIGPIDPARPSEDRDLNRPFGIIQPTVLDLGGEHLRLYARSTAQHIYISDSYDSGLSWSQPEPLALPNPNSGIDAVRLRDGRIVLIYNDSPRERTPLNLAVSDDGEHFQNFYTLEDQPGEYSYPAIIQESDGNLAITYTWQRKSIRFVEFPLSQIPKPRS